MKSFFTVLVCLTFAQVLGQNGQFGFSAAAAQEIKLSDESVGLAREIDAKMRELQDARTSGTKTPGPELDALNARLRQMKADLLGLGRRFFTSIGAEVEDIVMNEAPPSQRKHPSLKVVKAEGLFGRFLAEKYRQNDGMIFVFNPSELSTGNRTAVYDTTVNSLSVAWRIDEVVRLKSPELFHELTHAILTRLAYHQGADSVYASVLGKKKRQTMLDGLNSYRELFTAQEFATYAAETVQLLRFAKEAKVEQRNSLVNQALVKRMLPPYFAGLDAIIGTKALLLGLNDGSTTIGPDAEKTGEGIGRHILVENELYKYYFSFPPGTADEDLRSSVENRLRSINRLATEFIARGEDLFVTSGIFDRESLASYKESLGRRFDMMTMMLEQVKFMGLSTNLEMTDKNLDLIRESAMAWNRVARRYVRPDPKRFGGVCPSMLLGI